jgi:hypothetical protein
MEISVEKFLALTALLAASALPACTVTTVDSGDHGNAGGGTGTAGSTGTAGTAGTAGSASTEGGTGGTGGSASTEGSDDGGVADASADSAAPAACFAEGADDGGNEGVCGTLPYAADTCPDPGGEGMPVLGVQLCDSLQARLKPAAFTELFNCLKAAPGVGDGGAASCMAHETAAAACSKAIFNRSTCAVPDGVADGGGALGCTQIVASCPANDAGSPGITLAQCQAWLSPFGAAARQAALSCGIDPSLDDGGATNCADKFENFCVFGQ